VVLNLAVMVLTTILPPAKSSEAPQMLILIPLTILGVGYSIFAATCWGCIPFTMPSKLLGTAFGLSTCLQNVGLTVAPEIAAMCLKTSK